MIVLLSRLLAVRTSKYVAEVPPTRAVGSAFFAASRIGVM